MTTETEYYDNGQMKFELNFKNGEPDGLHTFWYADGEIKERVIFKKGQKVEIYHMRIIEK